jgi:hypothetical protein
MRTNPPRQTLYTIIAADFCRGSLTADYMTRLASAFGCRPADIRFYETVTESRHIDPEMLRRAYEVVDGILVGEDRTVRQLVMPDLLVSLYEVLAEARADGRELDDQALRIVAASNRAILRRLKPR